MSSSEHVTKLKNQRDKLNARIQKLEASEKALEKKRDTRRKILIGAYFLKEAREQNTFEGLKLKLDDFLIRSSDRALFGLNEQS